MRTPKGLQRAITAVRNKARKIRSLQRQLQRAAVAYDLAIARARWHEDNLRRNPVMNPLGIGWMAKRVYQARVPRDLRLLDKMASDRRSAIARLSSQMRTLQARLSTAPVSSSTYDQLVTRLMDTEARLEVAERELTDYENAREAAAEGFGWYQRNPYTQPRYTDNRREVLIERLGPKYEPNVVRLSNPGGADMAEGLISSVTNIHPAPELQDGVIIGAGAEPKWQDVQAQLPRQSANFRGRLINYNPSNPAWMAFLANWRRTHARPHTLAESRQLMRDAGAAYRSHSNPAFLNEEVLGLKLLPPRALGQKGNMATAIIGVILLGAVKMWQKFGRQKFDATFGTKF